MTTPTRTSGSYYGPHLCLTFGPLNPIASLRWQLDAVRNRSVGFAPANPTFSMGFELMIRTRTAGQVAAMIPDRLCCCPEVTTEAETGLEPLARP
jgi:hypothetical protein